jgi:CHAT domain
MEEGAVGPAWRSETQLTVEEKSMSRAPAKVPVASIEYEELEIEVGRCLCGEGEVRILGSRFDRPRERFRPSYDVEELNRRLEELDKLQLAQGPEAASMRKQLAESIGQDLYQALLPGRVRQTFGNSLAALRTVRAERNVGLRIRLSFGEASRYIPEVVGLPWELLCSPETLEFPSSTPETPLVRYLDLERPVESVKITPPIRILGVLASPRELRLIDREMHEGILRGACGRNGLLELKLLRPPTLSALREQLDHDRANGKPIHVVHFLGHGAFDDNGEGALNFEHPDGSRHRVSGRDLARALGGFREVRLVVLSTCVGARMMRRRGQHPFAGSASALVAGGLPAVVGMQFPVSEVAASEFARSFYHHLAKGRPLEEAVTEGRLRILTTESSTFEWASPVLFLRARDGKVLDLADDSRRRQREDSGTTLKSGRDLYNAEVIKIAHRDYIQAGGDVNQAGGDINIGNRPRGG